LYFCLFQFYLGENKDDVIEIEESKKEASKLIEATATTIEVETRGQCYKTFFFETHKLAKKASVFVSGKLIFAGEARTLPQSGAPERVSFSVTHKHYTRLERLAI